MVFLSPLDKYNDNILNIFTCGKAKKKMNLVLICHVPVLVSDKKRISWFKKAGSNWG